MKCIWKLYTISSGKVADNESIFISSTTDSSYLMFHCVPFSINEIVTTSLVGIVKSRLTRVSEYSRDYYVNITWSPTEDQLGESLFCFSATDVSGYENTRLSAFISAVINNMNSFHVFCSARRLPVRARV